MARVKIQGTAALYTAATLFAVGSLLVKLASAAYGGVFISAMRFAVGAGLCVAAIRFRKGSFRPVNAKAVILRGAFGAMAMVASFSAIALTGPGRASLLSNIYPLFVPVFAALFFGEPFQKSTLASMALCTAGAFAVVRDGSGANLAGDLVALAGAFAAAVAINFVRRASATDDPVLIYLSPCLFGLPVFAVARAPASFPGILPTLAMVAVGVLSFFAQQLMTEGYRTVPAGRGSLVFFWETALTVALGVAVTGEKVNLRFGAGLVLILAGLYLNRRNAAPRSCAGA